MRDNWILPRKQKAVKFRMEWRQDSCIHGYHVCNEIWTAVLGEVLITERELHNMGDRYAGETVGHLPIKISRLYSMFIEQGGNITCVVTGNRRYSSDLVQGGLEIPCSIQRRRKIFH